MVGASLQETVDLNFAPVDTSHHDLLSVLRGRLFSAEFRIAQPSFTVLDVIIGLFRLRLTHRTEIFIVNLPLTSPVYLFL